MSQEKHRKELSEIIEGKVFHHHQNNFKRGHKGRRVTHTPVAAIAPVTEGTPAILYVHLCWRNRTDPDGAYEPFTVPDPNEDPNYFANGIEVPTTLEAYLMTALLQLSSIANSHFTEIVTADSSGVDKVPVGTPDWLDGFSFYFMAAKLSSPPRTITKTASMIPRFLKIPRREQVPHGMAGTGPISSVRRRIRSPRRRIWNTTNNTARLIPSSGWIRSRLAMCL
jgi:hypothetical protein